MRKLNSDELFRLRKRVVSLRKKGLSGKEIERIAHVRANRISEIWRRYLDGGVEGIRPGTPGRKPGEGALLPAQHEREIRRTMISKTPDQLKMPFSLWTRQVASDFIRREYGVRLSLRSMTNYFQRWGFICRAPAKADEFRQRPEFKHFIKEDFQAIVRRAAFENVGVYWFCETLVSTEPNHGGRTGPQPSGEAGSQSSGEGGSQPSGRTGSQRIKMAAAATARGTVRFMFFEGDLSQEMFITLMSRLIRYADRKVFFIAADVKPFRGEKVRAWLKDHEPHIEVFYHPA